MDDLSKLFDQDQSSQAVNDGVKLIANSLAAYCDTLKKSGFRQEMVDEMVLTANSLWWQKLLGLSGE